jgi:hypothetical protein
MGGKIVDVPEAGSHVKRKCQACGKLVGFYMPAHDPAEDEVNRPCPLCGEEVTLYKPGDTVESLRAQAEAPVSAKGTAMPLETPPSYGEVTAEEHAEAMDEAPPEPVEEAPEPEHVEAPEPPAEELSDAEQEQAEQDIPLAEFLKGQPTKEAMVDYAVAHGIRIKQWRQKKKAQIVGELQRGMAEKAPEEPTATRRPAVDG